MLYSINIVVSFHLAAISLILQLDPYGETFVSAVEVNRQVIQLLQC